MFQLEKINDLFNCKICEDILVNPILLPCGETVCKPHTDEISKGKCVFCSGTHIAPKEGFPENRIVKHQLDLEINKINLNFSQFKDYKRIIQDLNKKLKEIVAIRNDPENYIPLSKFIFELNIKLVLKWYIILIEKLTDYLLYQKNKVGNFSFIFKKDKVSSLVEKKKKR